METLDPDWIQIRIGSRSGLDPDPDWIRIGIQPKLLVPDLYQMNTDPKHCSKVSWFCQGRTEGWRGGWGVTGGQCMPSVGLMAGHPSTVGQGVGSLIRGSLKYKKKLVSCHTSPSSLKWSSLRVLYTLSVRKSTSKMYLGGLINFALLGGKGNTVSKRRHQNFKAK